MSSIVERRIVPNLLRLYKGSLGLIAHTEGSGAFSRSMKLLGLIIKAKGTLCENSATEVTQNCRYFILIASGHFIF